MLDWECFIIGGLWQGPCDRTEPVEETPISRGGYCLLWGSNHFTQNAVSAFPGNPTFWCGQDQKLDGSCGGPLWKVRVLLLLKLYYSPIF